MTPDVENIIINKFLQDGKSVKEIAEASFVSPSTIYRIFKKRNINIPSTRQGQKKKENVERDQRIIDWYQKGFQIRQIADMEYCSISSVYHVLNSMSLLKHRYRCKDCGSSNIVAF